MTFDELRGRATCRVEEAGVVLDISRSSAYEQARLYLETDGAEGIPVIRVGRRLRVAVPALLSMLGAESKAPAADERPGLETILDGGGTREAIRDPA